MSGNLGVERYDVIRLVGRGGMGELYEVWDQRLERMVAVKRLHPQTLERLGGEAFVLKEARAAAKIEHPNVVRVYGVEKSADELLIEMEFIKGRPLVEVLDGAAMPGYLAADLLKQILNGLEACHARRVIHCDLKPANILVNPRGNIYITDFGIARALRVGLDRADEADVLTGTFGTPRYSPPEAWRGEEPTLKWDLYAAGLVIYEALTGTCPIGGETVADIRAEVFRGPRQTLRERRPDLSPEFCALIEALMAPHADDRPSSAREALSKLRQTHEYKEGKDSTRRLLARHRAESPGGAESITASETPEPTAARAYFAWGGVALVLSLVAAMIAYSSRHTTAPATTPPPAAMSTPLQQVAPPQTPPKLREPLNLVIAGTTAYFAYDDGIHGNELWGITEDQRAVLLKDINPGPASSNPTNFLPLETGAGVLFAATDPECGQELWHSGDLTNYNTPEPRRITDAEPGPMGSLPVPVMSKTPYHLFLASTLKHGRELWCTSLREGQTAMVEDLCDDWCDSLEMVSCMLPLDNAIMFKAIYDQTLGYSLCKFTLGDTRVVHLGDVYDHLSSMMEYKGFVYFMNHDPEHGEELWRHDLKSTRLEFFKDLAPGPFGSWPKSYFVWNDTLYFVAETEEAGIELWHSDGTPEGTRLLADINPGKGHSNVFKYTPTSKLLYFVADTEAYGREFWCTDGTRDGTRLVVDANPGPAWSSPYSNASIGDRVFFTCDDGTHGEELWVVDRPAGGLSARMVVDLYPGPISAGPHDLRIVKDTFGIFNARYSETNSWIHRLDVDGDTITVTRLPAPGDLVEVGETP